MTFQEFFDQAVQWKPEIATAVEGATDAEIQELETLCGQKLPDDYRQFLQRMGRDLGPMTVTRNGEPCLDASVQAVLSAHRKAARKPMKGKAAWYFFGVEEGVEGLLLFAMDRKGNDNGHYFLNPRKAGLPVVEVTETLGIVERFPTLWAAVFSSQFPAQVRRALSTRALP